MPYFLTVVNISLKFFSFKYSYQPFLYKLWENPVCIWFSLLTEFSLLTNKDCLYTVASPQLASIIWRQQLADIFVALLIRKTVSFQHNCKNVQDFVDSVDDVVVSLIILLEYITWGTCKIFNPPLYIVDCNHKLSILASKTWHEIIK